MSVKWIFSNLQKYFLSDLFSQFASGLSFIALNWYVFQKTENISSVGFILSLDILGRFLAGPFAGVMIDKCNRKSMLILTNLSRAGCVLAFLIYLYYFPFNLYCAYLLAFVGGVWLTVYMTASRAFIQEITQEVEVVKGQSYLEIGLQMGMLASGAVVGPLYLGSGIEIILVVEISALLLGGFFLISVENSKILMGSLKKGFFKNFMDGYHYLQSYPTLLIFSSIMILPYVATVSLNTIMPQYALTELHSNVNSYGLLCMFYGLGGISSGLLMNYIFTRYSNLFLIHGFLILSVISLVVLFFNSSIAFAYILFFAFGLANSSIKIILQALLAKNISNEYMGRITAFLQLLSTVLQILGIYLCSKFLINFPLFPSTTFLLIIMLITYMLFLLFSFRYKAVLIGVG